MNDIQRDGFCIPTFSVVYLKPAVYFHNEKSFGGRCNPVILPWLWFFFFRIHSICPLLCEKAYTWFYKTYKLLFLCRSMVLLFSDSLVSLSKSCVFLAFDKNIYNICILSFSFFNSVVIYYFAGFQCSSN